MPIGDAAYTIDPISGSGITRALKMADETAFVVARFVQDGKYEGVQKLAEKRVHEFGQLLGELGRYYSLFNGTFHDSNRQLFWRRRSKQKSK